MTYAKIATLVWRDPQSLFWPLDATSSHTLDLHIKQILKKISSVQLRFPSFTFMLLIILFVPAGSSWHPVWMTFKSSSYSFRKSAFIRMKALNIVRFPDGILQRKRY